MAGAESDAHGPIGTMNAENAGVPADDPARPVWPRWAAITLVVAGAVVIVSETTSYLGFAGVLLTSIGAYEFATGMRSRRNAPGPLAAD